MDSGVFQEYLLGGHAMEGQKNKKTEEKKSGFFLQKLHGIPLHSRSVHLFITKGKIDVNENRKIFPGNIFHPANQAKKAGARERN
jgi:hypothetical protein